MSEDGYVNHEYFDAGVALGFLFKTNSPKSHNGFRAVRVRVDSRKTFSELRAEAAKLVAEWEVAP